MSERAGGITFCDVCSSVMTRTPRQNTVVFICDCGYSVNGADHDTLIYSNSNNTQTSASLYAEMIKNAPFDRTSLRVAESCGKCKLPYTTLVRIVSSEVIVKVCECGNQNFV